MQCFVYISHNYNTKISIVQLNNLCYNVTY